MTKRSPDLAEIRDRVAFVVPAKLVYRDAARAFIGHVFDELGPPAGFSPDTGLRVISAFVEAFNNTVLHAYRGRPFGMIAVDLEIREDRVLLQLSDNGLGFSPDDVPEPDLDSLPEGGLGLFIIKSFMDEVRYERRGDRNVLVMEKRRTPEDAGAIAEATSEAGRKA